MNRQSNNNRGTVERKRTYRISLWHSRKRRLQAGFGAGMGAMSLMIAMLFQEVVLERRWFPLVVTSAAVVLQIVCGTTIWKLASGTGCLVTRVASDSKGLERSSTRSTGRARKTDSGRSFNSSVTDSETHSTRGTGGGDHSDSCEGGARGRKAPEKLSARWPVGGDMVERGRATVEEKEESFHRHFALETPLQQAARTLEFVLDYYSPDARTREKLEMVLNIISLPEDLNMVTRQSIINADLDSSTTEWIEAQLSSGSSAAQRSWGEMNWSKFRDGLRSVVGRLAIEAIENHKDVSVTDTGMTSEQLRRQHDIGRAYRMEKAASESLRTRRRSSNINVSQLMNLRGARSRSGPQASATLYKVEECSHTEDMEKTDMDEKVARQGLMEVMPTLPGIGPDSQKALKDFMEERHFLDWDFDVFKLQDLSGGHALWYAGMLTLYHYSYVGVFNINPKNLSKFLAHVEKNYCYDPEEPCSYHTSVHAADVTLTVAHFCENSIIASGIKALQGFTLLVAAIVHDYRHKGVNNNYLIKVRDKLAITYNDSSVLENFHLSEAFKVLYDDRTNILEGLVVEEMRQFRQSLIKIILATDLAHGFEYVARFTASTTTKGGRRASIVPDMAREGSGGVSPGGGGGSSGGSASSSSALVKGGGSSGKDPLQAQILLMQMVIKVADVSHPMKPWELHERWTKLITEEFHRQGDLEKEKRIPISPLCNREAHNQAKSQCDFINFVVRPCASVFSEFCKDKVWIATLEKNFRRWSEMNSS